MNVQLCAECYLDGYCRRMRSRVVDPGEMTPDFIRDLRNYAARFNLRPDEWPSFLIEAYRDYPGLIVDIAGDEEVDLDTGVFDGANIRTWFRDLCRPVVPGKQVRLRRESEARYVVMASILRAIDPVGTKLWGCEIANDNPSEPVDLALPSGRDCPYPHFTISKADLP